MASVLAVQASGFGSFLLFILPAAQRSGNVAGVGVTRAGAELPNYSPGTTAVARLV